MSEVRWQFTPTTRRHLERFAPSEGVERLVTHVAAHHPTAESRSYDLRDIEVAHIAAHVGIELERRRRRREER